MNMNIRYQIPPNVVQVLVEVVDRLEESLMGKKLLHRKHELWVSEVMLGFVNNSLPAGYFGRMVAYLKTGGFCFGILCMFTVKHCRYTSVTLLYLAKFRTC